MHAQHSASYQVSRVTRNCFSQITRSGEDSVTLLKSHLQPEQFILHPNLYGRSFPGEYFFIMGFQMGFLRSTLLRPGSQRTGARCGVASHRATYIEDIIDRAFSSTNMHYTSARRIRPGLAPYHLGQTLRGHLGEQEHCWIEDYHPGYRRDIALEGCHRAPSRSTAAIDAASEGLVLLSSAGWLYRVWSELSPTPERRWWPSLG